MPVRKGSAQWQGDLKNGKGTLSTESGVLNNIAYNFTSRFEEGDLTNPEEILGAAHSACFTMALANNLSNDGFKVNSIKTEDKVHLNKLEEGFKITKIEINCEADIDDVDDSKFQEHANNTKSSCPVSKALTGVEFVLNAKLV